MAAPKHKLRIPHEVAAVIRHLHPQLKQKVRAALRTIQADPYNDMWKAEILQLELLVH